MESRTWSSPFHAGTIAAPIWSSRPTKAASARSRKTGSGSWRPRGTRWRWHGPPRTRSSSSGSIFHKGTVQALVLKVESTGESQTFLETYEDQCRNAGPIMNLFQGPEVAWKSLQLEAAYVVGVTLTAGSQVIFFRANLVGIKATRAWKNGAAVFTYQLQLEKDLEPETDKDLAHFVNAKEMNARTLKMETVKWPFQFEALEPMAQSVDPETGGADGNEGEFED